jgi:biopolymer transport protein ExbD
MGLKKRSKVSAEFSMSSLTDIIFLLLIFFMLTSTLVRIQPFELPESDSKTVAPTNIMVSIEKDGRHTLNGTTISTQALERAMKEGIAGMENRDNVSVTIVAEVGTPFDDVVEVMNMAARLRIKAILATQPRS